MINPLGWFDRLIVPLLSAIAGLVLFVMMLLTCADVFGRYFMSAPLLGALELTEILLASLIFTGLPLVTLHQEHITVDVLDGVTPDWLLRVQHVVATTIACVATAYLAWRLYLRGGVMMAAGETTAQLKLQLFWLTYAMSILMALTSLAFFVLIFRRPSRQVIGES